MKHFPAMMTAFFCLGVLNAQQPISQADSSDILETVTVRAYENNGKLIQVPAAVSVISKSQLSRYSSTSILPALNTAPGVRMEERSPASYRLNIRGSSLRSPFGVRNVKVYYNGIPFTDPGGNTFLNQLGFYNVTRLEVIKGPGSSLYGAGTGGVVLIGSNDQEWRAGIRADISAGSFHTTNANTQLDFGTEAFHNTVGYQQLNSDGYRVQTRSDRKVFSWNAVSTHNKKSSLTSSLLYSDLFYETPGALTLNEFVKDPRAARPRTGSTPGAVEAQAAIHSKLLLAGFSYTYSFNDHFKNTTSLYGAFSELKNPTTRNYERRTEPHTGGRTLFEYDFGKKEALFKWITGAELQQDFGTSRVSGNIDGRPETLQTDDETHTLTWFVFSQLAAEFSNGWSFTGGLSLNRSKVTINRLYPVPSMEQRRTYDNEIAPRLSVLKKLNDHISAYATVAKGFSPPTTAELLPSTGIISTSLNAEEGYDYELGTRGTLLKGRLFFDINGFLFRLANTIAQRRDFAGADYFVNAGSTKQHGIETYLLYRIIDQPKKTISKTSVWISHTWHDFHYNDFRKVADDTADYSGNRLPSIPEHFIAAGFDMATSFGFYTNITWTYSDPVPLNDANSDYASSFNLLGARAGFKKRFGKNFIAEVYGAADNIFNVHYSLGNDINAFGNRYYNAAPGINYMAGLSVEWNW